MQHRNIVLRLLGIYTGFVLGVTVLHSPGNLLGSTFTFFTSPSATERVAQFDRNQNSIPDFVDGPRILEIFRSAPGVFAPMLGQSQVVPEVIRIDDRYFEMPAGHTAAPQESWQEETEFNAVELRWGPSDVRVDPSLDWSGMDSPATEQDAVSPAWVNVSGTAPGSEFPSSVPSGQWQEISPVQYPTAPSWSNGPYLVPTLPEGGAETQSVSPAVPAAQPIVTPSTTPTPPTSVVAPPSSTPPVMSTPPMSTPPFSTPPMSLPGGGVHGAPPEMDCNYDGMPDDMCSDICKGFWPDIDNDGIKDKPPGCP